MYEQYSKPGKKFKQFNLVIFSSNEKLRKLSTFRENRFFTKPDWFEFYLLLLLFLGSGGVEGGGPPALISEALLRDDGEEPVESSYKIMSKKLADFRESIRDKRTEKCNKNS
jgi:hypothetical protein